MPDETIREDDRRAWTDDLTAERAARPTATEQRRTRLECTIQQGELSLQAVGDWRKYKPPPVVIRLELQGAP